MSQDTDEAIDGFAVKDAPISVPTGHEVWRLRLAVFDRVIHDPNVDLSVNAMVMKPQEFRSKLRLGVARGLAAEGIVMNPSDWANRVKDITEFISSSVSGQITAEKLKQAEAQAVVSEGRRQTALASLESLRKEHREALSTTSGLVSALSAAHDVDVDVLTESNVEHDSIPSLRIHFEGIRLDEDGDSIKPVRGRRGKVKVGIQANVYISIEDEFGDDKAIIEAVKSDLCLDDGSEYEYDGHDVYIHSVHWSDADFIEDRY